jgi:hypothetical protein
MKNDLDSVERWLIHENYKFSEIKNDENNFQIGIKHTGSFGVPIEIFQPKNQPNILVIGGKIPLKNRQNSRYLNFNDMEKENFKKKAIDYCNSIHAIPKFFDENGKKVVGVYVVLDDESKLNQQDFANAIQQVIEMSEKTTQYLMKTF